MGGLGDVSISITSAVVYGVFGAIFFLLIFLLVLLGVTDCNWDCNRYLHLECGDLGLATPSSFNYRPPDAAMARAIRL